MLYSLAGCLLSTTPALAATTLDFSGFGTLGIASLDTANAEYRSNLAQDGADENGSLELDTRLGLQADLVLSPRLGATVQLLAQEGYDGDPRVDIEWAFGQWFIDDTWSMRVGRMALPVFLTSDSRYIGYAMAPMRPPEEVYALVPIGSFDGLDLIGNFEFGETLLNVQLHTGVADERGYDGLRAEASISYGMNVVVDRGISRVRLGYIQTDVLVQSEQTNQLADGITQALPLIPTLAPIAEKFDSEEDDISLFSLGLELDFDRVFINTEFSRRNIDSWIPKAQGWSVLMGARFGQLTPYAFASSFRENEGDRTVTLPPIPALNELQRGLDLLLGSRNQSSVGLGARWDLIPGVAIKAQVEQVSRDEIGTSFLRTTVDDGSDTGADVILYGLSMEVVF